MVSGKLAMANCWYVSPSSVHYCHSAVTITPWAIRTRSRGPLVSHLKVPIVRLLKPATGFCPTCTLSSIKLTPVEHPSYAHSTTTIPTTSKQPVWKMNFWWAIRCSRHLSTRRARPARASIFRQVSGWITGVATSIPVMVGAISKPH